MHFKELGPRPKDIHKYYDELNYSMDKYIKIGKSRPWPMLFVWACYKSSFIKEPCPQGVASIHVLIIALLWIQSLRPSNSSSMIQSKFLSSTIVTIWLTIMTMKETIYWNGIWSKTSFKTHLGQPSFPFG